MAIRTFLDTSVLLAAHRGKPADRGPCLAIVNDHESIVMMARDESERCGLAAMDALHVAAAALAEAEVLYTLERKDKPIHRTSLVQIVCVEPEANTPASCN